jgi:hypothetical protein
MYWKQTFIAGLREGSFRPSCDIQRKLLYVLDVL